MTSDSISLSQLAARMGISLPKLPIAPPITVYCSQFAKGRDGKSIRVNGHKSRCDSFQDEWYTQFKIDISLKPIFLVDIAPDYSEDDLVKDSVYTGDHFTIEITDVSTLATLNPNVVINYKLDATRPYGSTGLNLLGKEWFFSDAWTTYPFGYVNSDEPNILVIPNGNKKEFFANFDIATAHHLLSTHGGGCLSVVNNTTKHVLMDYVDLASIIITTPSVTAMECLSIGIPLLLIKTSDDQTDALVEHGLAKWYTEGELADMLCNKSARIEAGKLASETIKNNAKEVVYKIRDEWEKYNDNKS